MSDETARLLLSMSDRLFSEKAPFDRLCQNIAEHFYPERATFTREVVLGEEFATDIYDSYPVMARRDLGNAFSSMLRPRGKEWFSVKPKGVKDLSAYGKAWLEGSGAVMRAVFYDAKTRFVRSMRETDHDYAAFGNAILSCEPSRDRSTLLYRSWHIGQVAWGEDEAGFPTPICRKEKMSARELERTFQDAELPSKVRDAAKDPKKQFNEFDVVHVVMPTDQWALFSDKKFRQPWVSIYILRDGAIVLRSEGIRSKRYIIPRWQTVQGTQYALSPATIVALPDARMIQTMAMILLEAGEKAIDPPTIATKNAVLSDVNIFAGGVTWVDKLYDEREGAALRPLDLTGNLNFGADMLNLVRSRIADAFYLSKLTLPQKSGQTAYETARLVEEYIRAAIPLFEPLETDYTQPVLDSTFAELMDLGAFGGLENIPDELAGASVEFQFSNPLQETIETEKANKFTGLAQLLQVAAGVEQIQSQSRIAGNINADAAFRDAGMAVTPAAWWLDPADVQDLGPSEAEELQQAAEAASGIKTMADAAQSVGKAGITLDQAFTPQERAA